MYDGKARNAIIKYELKLNHEGNDDGKDEADDELVIDEDEVFDNKAPGLIDDGGDDSFLDFVNFDDSDYEYENEEELHFLTKGKGFGKILRECAGNMKLG